MERNESKNNFTEPVNRLGAVELQFLKIIWQNEPVTSGRLVELAEGELGWKKSTTYTVLKRLGGRGYVKNDAGTVSSCLSEQEYMSGIGKTFLDEAFEGSLPAFLAAFTSGKKLSDEEVREIKAMIDAYEGGAK